MLQDPPRVGPVPPAPPPGGGPPPRRDLPAPRDLPPVLDPTAERVPESHQLPPHQNKLERIGDHLAAISADLREFVELRIALAKAEVTEAVQQKVDEIERQVRYEAAPYLFMVVGGFFGLYLLGFTFALIAAAFAWIFGHHEVLPPTFFGILVAWVLLLLLTAVPVGIGLYIKKKREGGVPAEARRVEVPPASERPTRADIQDQERTHAERSAV